MKTSASVASVASIIVAGIGVSGTGPQQRTFYVPAVSTSATFSAGTFIMLLGEKSLDELIEECTLPENLEADEVPPKQKAIDDIKGLIAAASKAQRQEIELGDVIAYSGEISITWREGNRMLRATSFSDDRPTRLDFGTTPEASLGEYHFVAAPTGNILVQRLAWLHRGHA